MPPRRPPILLDEGKLDEALKAKTLKRRQREEFDTSYASDGLPPVRTRNHSERDVYIVDPTATSDPTSKYGILLLDESKLERALKAKADRRRVAEQSVERRRQTQQSVDRVLKSFDELSANERGSASAVRRRRPSQQRDDKLPATTRLETIEPELHKLRFPAPSSIHMQDSVTQEMESQEELLSSVGHHEPPEEAKQMESEPVAAGGVVRRVRKVKSPQSTPPNRMSPAPQESPPLRHEPLNDIVSIQMPDIKRHATIEPPQSPAISQMTDPTWAKPTSSVSEHSTNDTAEESAFGGSVVAPTSSSTTVQPKEEVRKIGRVGLPPWIKADPPSTPGLQSAELQQSSAPPPSSPLPEKKSPPKRRPVKIPAWVKDTPTEPKVPEPRVTSRKPWSKPPRIPPKPGRHEGRPPRAKPSPSDRNHGATRKWNGRSNDTRDCHSNPSAPQLQTSESDALESPPLTPEQDRKRVSHRIAPRMSSADVVVNMSPRRPTKGALVSSRKSTRASRKSTVKKHTIPHVDVEDTATEGALEPLGGAHTAPGTTNNQMQAAVSENLSWDEMLQGEAASGEVPTTGNTMTESEALVVRNMTRQRSENSKATLSADDPSDSYYSHTPSYQNRIPISWSARNEASTGFKPNEFITKETMTIFTNDLGGVQTVATTTRLFYDQVKADPQLKGLFRDTRWESVRNEFIILANLEVPDRFDEDMVDVLGSHCKLLADNSNMDRVLAIWESAIEASWLENKVADSRQLIVGPSRVIFNLRALQKHFQIYQHRQETASKRQSQRSLKSTDSATSAGRVRSPPAAGLLSRMRNGSKRKINSS